MPVTKTAKRALRGSTVKAAVNAKLKTNLEIAQRMAKSKPTAKTIATVFSLADRSVKKNLIHKNKAAHIKSAFSKLLAK